MEMTQRLYEAARAVRDHAHAPYSRFKVGAALHCEGQPDPITGCNVENASYGGTVCAERTALFKMVSDLGNSSKPLSIVIVTDSTPPAPPCALCLQVMAEFCDPDFQVHLADLEGIKETYRFDELLPKPFKFDV